MENFDREIKSATSCLPLNFEGCFLAGGAITSTFTNKPIRDYDLYFKNENSFLCAVQDAFEDGMWCVAVTDRAITFVQDHTVYQFMSFSWFDNAEQIFEKFDFRCCMGAIDFDTKEFLRHPHFLTDLAKRELTFNHKTDFPIASAMRVKKYQGKGFEITASEYLKVILAVAMKNPKNWEELRMQIGGQYGEAIKLDESKEFTIENAVVALADAIDNKTMEAPVKLQSASCYEEATKMIFGETKPFARPFDPSQVQF